MLWEIKAIDFHCCLWMTLSDQNLGIRPIPSCQPLDKKMFYKHAIFPSLKIINRMVWNTKLKSNILGHSSLNLLNCSYYLIPKRVIKRKPLLWWRRIHSLIRRFCFVLFCFFSFFLIFVDKEILNLEFLWGEFQHVIEEMSLSTEGMFSAKGEVVINLRNIKILFFFPQVSIYHYFWNGISLSSLISLTILLWSLPPLSSLTWITAEWCLLPASLAPL